VPLHAMPPDRPRERGYQAVLLMLRALSYIRTRFPFWNTSAGADHVWMMLHDEGPCFCPREIRPSILLTHYGYHASPARQFGTFDDDLFLRDGHFYRAHIGDPAEPTRCFDPHKDIVIAPWKEPSFWRGAFRIGLPEADALAGQSMAHDAAPTSLLDDMRPGLVYFAGDLGFERLSGYSHDLRQQAFALFCNPHTTTVSDCTPVAYHKPCDCECRKDLPQNCSLWQPGVNIKLHSSGYHHELSSHTFCLAFPGDGWSSRVLDAVVHGCIPVIVQDESYMFFEGSLHESGLPLDYANFSLRLREVELPQLVTRLRAVTPATIRRLRRAALWVRDYFVYKDMYNPSREERRQLLDMGRPGQDAFLLLARTLEARARAFALHHHHASRSRSWSESGWTL